MSFSSNGKGNPHPVPQLSLAEGLAPLVDEMRQLRTDMGMNPYRVFSVTVAWSSGQLYRGTPSVVCEKEFLPSPYVDLRSLYTHMTEAGQMERGEIVMRRISPSLTEDQIKELCFNGSKLPDGHQGFIEIRFDSRKGDLPARRRFTVRGAPWYDANKFEWFVALTDEESPRERDGSIKSQHELNPTRVFRP